MSRADSPLRDRVIFLVGARRSGTNWLQRILDAHPDVAAIPSETYLFSKGILPLRERFQHGVRGSTTTGVIYMDEEDLLDALRDFCDRALLPFLEEDPRAKRLVERTPEHATCVDLIGSIYPDAHIVHIIRDGRDVARSLVNQTWSTAPASITDAAEEWRATVEAAEAAGDSLEHFHTVGYERMLADPLHQISTLYEKLGLPSGKAIVEAVMIEAAISYNADPGDPGIGVGKWQKSFSPADHEAFLRVAGETLERFGYDVSTEAAPQASPSASTARARGRRIVRRPRRSVDREKKERDFGKQISARARTIQHNLDRVVAAINLRQLDRIGDMATPSIFVRVVDDGAEWTGRGPDAWARLNETVVQDPALGGRQIRGDITVSVPTATATMTFETASGRALRIVAVSFTGDRITRLTYSRWELGGGPASPA